MLVAPFIYLCIFLNLYILKAFGNLFFEVTLESEVLMMFREMGTPEHLCCFQRQNIFHIQSFKSFLLHLQSF